VFSARIYLNLLELGQIFGKLALAGAFGEEPSAARKNGNQKYGIRAWHWPLPLGSAARNATAIGAVGISKRNGLEKPAKGC
jgi:hypothetical protein